MALLFHSREHKASSVSVLIAVKRTPWKGHKGRPTWTLTQLPSPSVISMTPSADPALPGRGQSPLEKKSPWPTGHELPQGAAGSLYLETQLAISEMQSPDNYSQVSWVKQRQCQTEGHVQSRTMLVLLALARRYLAGKKICCGCFQRANIGQRADGKTLRMQAVNASPSIAFPWKILVSHMKATAAS